MPGLRVLSCPNCGASVSLRAAGLSVSAICGSCGSTIDVADPGLRLIAGAAARTEQPAIAIGTRATLVGTAWEVIGWQRRRDAEAGFGWEEYLLFNPYEGFRFLVADGEDWTLYAMLRQDVPEPTAGAGDGRRYKPTSTGKARTEYVLGEFYWRVRVGDEVDMAEWAAEPWVLSREGLGAEIIWSRGVRVPSATIRAAFKLDAAAAPATVTDLRQVRRRATRAVLLVFCAAAAALLLAEFAPFGLSRDARVFSQRLTVAQVAAARPFMSDPFTIPDRGGNLRITAAAAVRNSWVALNLSLVDQADSHSFDAPLTIEAYDGYDSDGYWSEGGQSNQVTFARVPGGTYRLLIDVDAQSMHKTSADGTVQNPAGFTVAVQRHVHSTWNVALALLCLVPYPLWRWLVGRARDAG